MNKVSMIVLSMIIFSRPPLVAADTEIGASCSSIVHDCVSGLCEAAPGSPRLPGGGFVLGVCAALPEGAVSCTRSSQCAPSQKCSLETNSTKYGICRDKVSTAGRCISDKHCADDQFCSGYGSLIDQSQKCMAFTEAKPFHAFGLVMGGSKSDNSYQLIRPFELSEKLKRRDELELSEKLERRDEHFCEREIFEDDNRYGANYAADGRLSGGYYSVPAFGKSIDLCFIYFDDHLLRIITTTLEHELWSKARDALKLKYDEHTSGNGRYTYTTNEVSVSVRANILPQYNLDYFFNQRKRKAPYVRLNDEVFEVLEQFNVWKAGIHESALNNAAQSSPF